jgi:hypothetical protein
MTTVAPRRRRATHRGLAALALAGPFLAACGTPHAAPAPRLAGTPATSFSVPLTNVGCTRDDVCVAVGTSATSNGLAAVGEFSTARSPWIDLALPATASPLITSTACAGTTCLIGGSQPRSDLLWVFSAATHRVAPTPTPAGGVGVDALSCATFGCALVDNAGAGEPPRISFTTDETTWSTPAPIPWAAGDAVSSLACGSATDCLISALTSEQHLVLYATDDAGATWTMRTTPAKWTTITSLSCSGRRCDALASTASDSLAVRTSNLGRSWTHVTLPAGASALGCATLTECVAVGRRSDDGPWLAGVARASTEAVRLRYVPTALLDVACGTKLCAAIGVTTLVTIPLPLQSSREQSG